MMRFVMILLLSFSGLAGCHTIRGASQVMDAVEQMERQSIMTCPDRPAPFVKKTDSGFWLSKSDMAELLIYQRQLEQASGCATD